MDRLAEEAYKFIANKDNQFEELLDECEKRIEAEEVKIYIRFAQSDINIIQARKAYGGEAPLETYVLTVEYRYKKDDKLIWPKIAVEGRTLLRALQSAEEMVKAIREA